MCIAHINNFLWSVYTVWRRNFVVFRKTWIVNLLPPFSEPIVYLVGFGYGLGGIINNFKYNGVEVAYIEFVASGMVCVALLLQSFFESSYGTFIRTNFQKTWNSILTTPVTFTEIYIGELLWASSKGIFAAFITACVGNYLGAYSITDFFKMLPLFLLGGICFASLGLCSSALAKTVDHVQIPVFLLLIPMFSLCGAYFPIDGLPFYIKNIVKVLPFTPFVELARLNLFDIKVNILGNLLLIIFWTILSTCISYRAFYKKIIT